MGTAVGPQKQGEWGELWARREARVLGGAQELKIHRRSKESNNEVAEEELLPTFGFPQ